MISGTKWGESAETRHNVSRAARGRRSRDIPNGGMGTATTHQYIHCRRRRDTREVGDGSWCGSGMVLFAVVGELGNKGDIRYLLFLLAAIPIALTPRITEICQRSDVLMRTHVIP